MGMSTHVVGFRPPDEKWKAMKAVWDALLAAGVRIPDEVHRFFEWAIPDERGVEVKLTEPCLKAWEGEGGSGFEVDVKKLPPDVTIIRFYNSW